MPLPQSQSGLPADTSILACSHQAGYEGTLVTVLIVTVVTVAVVTVVIVTVVIVTVVKVTVVIVTV